MELLAHVRSRSVDKPRLSRSTQARQSASRSTKSLNKASRKKLQDAGNGDASEGPALRDEEGGNTVATKTVADLVVQTLAAAGVERVYGVSGDSLNGITD